MSALGSACLTEPRTNLGWFPADRHPLQRETQHGELAALLVAPRGWKLKRGLCGAKHPGQRIHCLALQLSGLLLSAKALQKAQEGAGTKCTSAWKSD